MRSEHLQAIRRRVSCFAAVLLAAVAAIDCTAPTPRVENAPPTFARIVSLSPALTEVLFALNVGDRVVGVTDYCDYPPAARERPKVGGYATPSVEAVLALKPDLVLVSPGPGNRDAALALQRAGVRVEVIQAETVDESLLAIAAVARLCGVEPQGSTLVAAIRQRLEAVAAKAKGRPAIPALFSVQIDPVIAAGAGTLPSQLLEIAGGRNVVAAARYPRLGIESVIDAAPEVIIQTRMDVADAASARREETFWNRWPAIPAVRSGRVFVLTAPVSLRPGPRIAEAAEQLEAILHGPPPAAGTAERP